MTSPSHANLVFGRATSCLRMSTRKPAPRFGAVSRIAAIDTGMAPLRAIGSRLSNHPAATTSRPQRRATGFRLVLSRNQPAMSE